MKWSKYNYFFQNKKKYFLYNSLSNSFAEFDKKSFNTLLDLSRSNNVVDLEDESLDVLKKMRAIVENEDDIIQKIRYRSLCRRFDNHRLNLTINPTLSCNFSCPYCFEASHEGAVMSTQIEDGIINFIKSHNQAKTVDVTWFGGEPLLAFSRMESLTAKIQSLGLEYRAGIITNGYLLTESIIEKLDVLNVKSIQITLDGMKEMHNCRRFLKSGKGTFDKIIENIELLDKKKPHIRIIIRINVNKENQFELIDLYKYIKERNYSNTIFSPSFVENPTNTFDGSSLLLSREEQAEYIKLLYKQFGIEFTRFYPSLDRSECSVRNPNSVVIGPKGELYKCWNDVGDEKKVYGYIDGRIVNEPLLLRYLSGADPLNDTKCQECILFPVCGGGCPYYRLQNTYEGTKHDCCPLLKQNLKDFLLLHYQKKEQVKVG